MGTYSMLCVCQICRVSDHVSLRGMVTMCVFLQCLRFKHLTFSASLLLFRHHHGSKRIQIVPINPLGLRDVQPEKSLHRDN